MAKKITAKGQSATDFLKKIKDLSTLSKSSENKAKVLEELKKVYFVYGDEYFIRERVIQRLKEISKNLGFAIERVLFDKINMEEWVDTLYDISMFNSGRLIIASELSDLKEEQLGILLGYLKKPSPDVVLLILTEKIDKRKKTSSDILKHAEVCEAGAPDTKSYPMWINGFAAQRGKSVDDKVIEYLKARYSGDLARIEKEIEKASIYVGTRNIIREDDIEFLATGSSDVDIFKFPYLIATKNKKKFLEHLYKLVNAGEPPILICSIVSSRIKKLLIAQHMIAKDRSVSDSELAEETGTPLFFVKDIKSELLYYKPRELANMYKRCMSIDSQLKSSKSDPANVLTTGMLKLLERN